VAEQSWYVRPWRRERLDTCVRGGVVIDSNSRPWNHGFNSREIKPSDQDYIKTLISWTVTPSLVETFHAAFYSLHPQQSYWVASLARRLTGLVRRLAALAHRSTRNAQSFCRVTRLLTTPGQALTLSMRTNFVRKDSGCRCNLNLKILSPGNRTRNSTV